MVVDIALAAVLAVDLSSGDRVVIEDTDTGVGPSLSGTTSVALHTDTNRALMTAFNDDGAGLVWVDLSGSSRAALSNATTGTGPDFDALTGMVLDTQNDRAIVLDNTLDALISVDLTNGDRSWYRIGTSNQDCCLKARRQ